MFRSIKQWMADAIKRGKKQITTRYSEAVNQIDGISKRHIFNLRKDTVREALSERGN